MATIKVSWLLLHHKNFVTCWNIARSKKIWLGLPMFATTSNIMESLNSTLHISLHVKIKYGCYHEIQDILRMYSIVFQEPSFGCLSILLQGIWITTVYPKKYAHGFVMLCFVVVMQSFIMNSHEIFIHIHQGCFAGTGAIVRLPQCQWSKPDGYGKISQCITTTKHSKAKTVCIFLGIYCNTEAVLNYRDL